MASTTAMYDRIASTYGSDFGKAPGKLTALRKLISLLSESSTLPKTALDVGCGNGFPVAVGLHEAGIKVTGIDASEGMLQQARATGAGTFHQGTFDGWQPEGETPKQFGAVVFMFSLLDCEVSYLISTLRKYVGFLEKGGYLVIGTLSGVYHKGKDLKWEVTEEKGVKIEHCRKLLPFADDMVPHLLLKDESYVDLLVKGLGMELVFFDMSMWSLEGLHQGEPDQLIHMIARKA